MSALISWQRRVANMKWLGYPAAMVALLTCAIPDTTYAQGVEYQIRHDLLRGRVLSDSGRPIGSATIAITMAPNRVTQSTATDSLGRFEVRFDQGTGDYLVYVSAVGYRTVRKRVTRAAAESTFVVDISLASSAQLLAAVRVEAPPSRPNRDQGFVAGPGVGAAERIASGVVSSVRPDQRGDIGALAAAMPGIQALDGGGISVLGLPPEQSQVTLGGLPMSGATIPRGARATTTVATSTYDATRGGFSGAQAQIILAPGGILTTRQASATLDSPLLQDRTAAVQRLGGGYSAYDVNLGSSGDLKLDTWFYNLGIEAKRQSAGAASLGSASPLALADAGVSADSVARAISALRGLGIPVGAANRSPAAVSNVVSAIGRIDRPMFDYSTYQPLKSTWGALSYVRFQRDDNLGLGPLSDESRAGQLRRWDATLQANYSTYLGRDNSFLNEAKSGLSLSSSEVVPNSNLTAGRVLIASSDLTDPGIAGVEWGGNASNHNSSHRLIWETTDETTGHWFGRESHAGRVVLDSRFEWSGQTVSGNSSGLFAYNSLADLVANQPALFTRSFGDEHRSGGVWTGSVAGVDTWRPTRQLSVIYGLRLEVDRGLMSPAYNPDIDRLFGQRTDQTPGGINLSPRIGFNWVYAGASAGGSGVTYSDLGQFFRTPRGVLRGGIGRFRSALGSQINAEAAGATGLPGTATQLQCVGAAVPVPVWSQYQSDPAIIPDKCTDGSSPSLETFARNVSVIERGYNAPSSWRSNLSWSSSLGPIALGVDGIYSYNVDQPSTSDLNLRGTTQFAITNESSRPIFVPASTIVSSTGAVLASNSRLTEAYGQVFLRSSDLRSWARQVTISARPDVRSYGSQWVGNIWYTFSQGRSQTRGYEGSTDGDPRRTSWSRSSYLPTHELVLQAGHQGDLLVGTVYAKVRSGAPFTPLIATDINGDGVANDRAFVYSADAAGSTALSRGMRDLLNDSPTRVRECLAQQLGHIAERNSCDGPWTGTINANLQFGQIAKQRLGISRRTNINLSVVNVLGGLDALLHRGDLRGWGATETPQSTLLYVSTFDLSAAQFTYRVNNDFGRTRRNALAIANPFRLTLEVSVDLTPNSDEQQIARWLERGRHGNDGPRLDSAALMKRYERSLPDWYAGILDQADSLLLSREQVEKLQAARAAYVQRMTAHWGPTAAILASLPNNYDARSAVALQTEAADAAWEIARQEVQTTLPRILTPVQLGLLSPFVQQLLNAKVPVKGFRYLFSSRSSEKHPRAREEQRLS